MAQYIDKSALIAEIERRMKLRQDGYRKYNDVNDFVAFEELEYLHDEFLPTLEVKEVNLEKELIEWHKEHFKKDGTFIGMSGFYLTNNSQMDIAKHFFELGMSINKYQKNESMIEALRTEYEKGRADVIADTLSWLENCWPKYCSNQTIIEGFKEAIKGE